MRCGQIFNQKWACRGVRTPNSVNRRGGLLGDLPHVDAEKLSSPGLSFVRGLLDHLLHPAAIQRTEGHSGFDLYAALLEFAMVVHRTIPDLALVFGDDA